MITIEISFFQPLFGVIANAEFAEKQRHQLKFALACASYLVTVRCVLVLQSDADAQELDVEVWKGIENQRGTRRNDHNSERKMLSCILKRAVRLCREDARLL